MEYYHHNNIPHDTGYYTVSFELGPYPITFQPYTWKRVKLINTFPEEYNQCIFCNGSVRSITPCCKMYTHRKCFSKYIRKEWKCPKCDGDIFGHVSPPDWDIKKIAYEMFLRHL